MVRIIFVHGTWARQENEFNEGTIFSKNIEDEFNKVANYSNEIVYTRFTWSGKNNFEDRKKASKDLLELLDVSKNSSNYIVSHSHGGNVAISAASHDDSNISGIITLNTPFISALSKDSVWLMMTIYLYYTILSIWLGGALVKTDASFLFQLPLVLLAVMPQALALASWFPGNPDEENSLEKIRQLSKVKRYKYLKEYNQNRLRKCKLFCLTCSDDEAFSLLNLTEAISNIPSLLLSRGIHYYLLFIFILLVCFGYLPAVNYPWEVVTGGVVFESGLLKSAFRCIGSILLYFFLFLVGMQIVSLIIFTIFQGISIGVWKIQLSNLFVRLHTSVIPTNCSEVMFYDYKLEEPDDTILFSHSTLFREKKVARIIVSWIANNEKLHNVANSAAAKDRAAD